MSFSTFHPLLSISDFGDSAVLAGVVLILAFYLYVTKQKRWLGRLVLCVVLAGVAIVLSKLILRGCYPGLHMGGWWGRLTSPSGHAALGIVVYGSCFRVLQNMTTRKIGRLLGMAFVIFIGCIAASRALLGFHSWAEVVFGVSVGLLAYMIAWAREKPSSRNWQGSKMQLLLPLLLIATMLALHGWRLPAENKVHDLAVWLPSLGICTVPTV